MPVFIISSEPGSLSGEIIEVRDKGKLMAVIRHAENGIQISILDPDFVVITERS